MDRSDSLGLDILKNLLQKEWELDYFILSEKNNVVSERQKPGMKFSTSKIKTSLWSIYQIKWKY